MSKLFGAFFPTLFGMGNDAEIGFSHGRLHPDRIVVMITISGSLVEIDVVGPVALSRKSAWTHGLLAGV
jgi:hypothetical protein